jgi:CBS domain-containing protein/HSP20 family molecular chaperone IbpA
MTPSPTKRARGADPTIHPWQKLRQGLEQLLSSSASPPAAGTRSWSPDLRVIDKRRELVFRLASRGIDPRKIQIRLAGNVLTLSGASVDQRPEHHGYRAFSRSIVLPRDVDAAQISAQARGSVLTVWLPKRRPTTDASTLKRLGFPNKVSEIMTREVRSVAPETFVAEAARAMATFDIGSLPVCEGGRVVGILTDRDVAVRVVARGLDPAGVRVKEIMTRDPLSCSPDDALADAEQIMADAQIRRLPVVDGDGKLVGYLSTAKIARSEQDARAGRLLRGVSEPGKPVLRRPAPAPRSPASGAE